METTRGAKGVSPPSSFMPVCPAFRMCREMKKPPYTRSPVLDDPYHDQQVMILRDLLRAVKEAAMRLSQLIDKRQQAYSVSPIRRLERFDKSDQQRSISSDAVLASTPSSVCALCGVALQLNNQSDGNPSEDLGVEDEDSIQRGDAVNVEELAFKNLENMFLARNPRDKMDDISGDFVIRESAFGRVSPKESDIRNVSVSTKDEQVANILDNNPRIRPGAEAEIKPKLLLVRQMPPTMPRHIYPYKPQQRRDIATQVLDPLAAADIGRKYKAAEMLRMMQRTPQILKMPPKIIPSADASTITETMYCPCACGLLTTDENIKTTRVSVESSSVIKEQVIKTKLEELGFRLPAKREPARERGRPLDDVRRAKLRAQRLAKERKPELQARGKRQEVTHLQLQAQVEELHRNIRFFRQENEYIRRLVDECRRNPARNPSPAVQQPMINLMFSEYME